MTPDGTLYVADAAGQVSRFDGAGSMTGMMSGAYATMVLVDGDGALWIADDEAELVNVFRPESYSGAADVRASSVVTSWSSEEGRGAFVDGGRAVFVHVPAP